MTDVRYRHTFSIRVALQIIKHISTGIYRDLAGSLKELVSNSFDSDAHDVWIHTGAPDFNSLTIEDNGNGMEPDLFEEAFENVGVSQKVLHPERYKSDSGRPTIGKFGIGFLAAAHMSQRILIRSFHDPVKPGFEAKMFLDPYFRYVDKVQTTDSFQFGTVDYGEIENPDHRRGTFVALQEVDKSRFHTVISRPAREFTPWPAPGQTEATPGAAMTQLVEGFLREGYISISKLSGREQILWNLGMISPVEYLDGGPIRAGTAGNLAGELIADLKAANQRYGFHVWYDGIQVRKPILFPTPVPPAQELVEEFDPEASNDTAVWPIEISGKPEDGRPVSARGYLFYQPYRIVPAEMRGLLPRVRLVGVGPTYENTLMRELKGERAIFRVQVSGELYVDRGLDEELNLDRTGFLDIAAEYQFLSRVINEKVRSLVVEFDRLGRRRRTRRTNIREERAVERLRGLLGGADLGLEIVRVSGIALRAARPFDYDKKSAYPLTRPFLVIDRVAKKLKVLLSMDNPEWIATIYKFDSLLERSKTCAADRRRLAEAMDRYFAEDGG